MLLPQRQDFVAVWRYLSAHAASNLFRESPARLARNISRPPDSGRAIPEP